MSPCTPGAHPGVAVVGATLAFLCLLLVFGCPPGWGSAGSVEYRTGISTLLDESGGTLLETSVVIVKGDEFISSGGHRYHVTSGSSSGWVTQRDYDFPQGVTYTPPRAEQGKPIMVGIYCSHPMEGYLPGDDGTAKMGIGVLCTALGQVLRAEGIEPVSDAGDAYGLVGAGSAALLDIHRDTAHAPYVELPPRGERASSTLMVVSRANPAWRRNLGFAFAWKGLADTLAPGLVRGILVVSHPLSQDASPRSLMLVVGDRFHDPSWAERGLRELVGMLPGVLCMNAGVPPGSGKPTWAAEARLAVRGLAPGLRGWMLLLALALLTALGGGRGLRARRGRG